MTYLANRPSRTNQILSFTPIIRTLVRATRQGIAHPLPNKRKQHSRLSGPGRVEHNAGCLTGRLPAWLAAILGSFGVGVKFAAWERRLRLSWLGKRLLLPSHLRGGVGGGVLRARCG